ncbi:pyridoxine/pyridoxal/pyridoxamine kinase [Bacillus sp. A116_S68]|nr:pyridoxine/pyridoxal/pyridoxamine kinase [Bacillus sp. A116_S68]
MSLEKVLTIAGSDSSGGAGIQADLKTFQDLGVYGMSALTTIVTMDPDNNWSHGVFPQQTETVQQQLKTIVDGIGVSAMKTGMLGSVEIVELVSNTIKANKLENIVVDPVMVCKGEDDVLHPETAESMKQLLVPKATIVTPNLFEAWQLSGVGPIKTVEQMKEAAEKIHRLGAKHVLIKGGSKLSHDKAVDVLYDGHAFELLESDKIETPYVHGAGCTYSAAITAELAKGSDVKTAVQTAKAFITEAIKGSFKLNQFIGPVNHGAYRRQLNG